MSFNNIIKKKNILLLPFSWLYKAGVSLYNSLYDFNVRKSYIPDVPTICIGNLSVGGTGKSPMVEYLLRLLHKNFSTAVISRGYKRKTKGFVLADECVTVTDIGDEPMQFHQKFADVAVAVGEKRADAIVQLLKKRAQIDIIILDDAFQHRAVTAGFNILLTDCNCLFTDDWYLPAGSLRDLKGNYKRADLIVVTKCDSNFSKQNKTEIINKIKPLPHQKLFFTSIAYGVAYNVFNGEQVHLHEINEIVLVTGIANPAPLFNYLKTFRVKLHHLAFSDHYNFSNKDIGDILGTYQSIGSRNKIILTTEKDAMRLKGWDELKAVPVTALPIMHHFLFDEGTAFDQLILRYIKK